MVVGHWSYLRIRLYSPVPICPQPQSGELCPAPWVFIKCSLYDARWFVNMKRTLSASDVSNMSTSHLIYLIYTYSLYGRACFKATISNKQIKVKEYPGLSDTRLAQFIYSYTREYVQCICFAISHYKQIVLLLYTYILNHMYKTLNPMWYM